MEDYKQYKKMYLELFNGVSEEIERLKELQKNIEDMYIGAEDVEK